MKFYVWDLDNGAERPEEPNVENNYADCAAEAYVEGRWSDMDYPKETRVQVEHVHEGKIVSQTFIVYAEPDVRFRAGLVKS